jgi:FKBP-type peptidyl-prolyl cis-trans isomerase
MKKYLIPFLSLAIWTGMVSCNDDVDPYDGRASQDDADILSYMEQENLDGYQKLSNDIYMKVLEEGDGKQAEERDVLQLDFTFTTLGNVRTDTISDYYFTPLVGSYMSGVGFFMPGGGLSFASTEIKVGGEYDFIIPSRYAYQDFSFSFKKVQVAPEDIVRMKVKLKASRNAEEQLAHEQERLLHYLDERDFPTVTPDESGIIYLTTTEGPDPDNTPTPADLISVAYEGRMLDGTIFDESDEFMIFDRGQLIQGWQEGLKMMAYGESGLLLVPSALAYGARGTQNSAIGAHEPLIFSMSIASE